MTPPGSVLISAYSQRALAYEAKGDLVRARQDYAAVLEGKASDAGSKANQATAKVRLSLLTETIVPTAPRMAKEAAPAPSAAPAARRVPQVRRRHRPLSSSASARIPAGAWRW